MNNDPQFKTSDGAALRMWKEAARNNFLSEKLGRVVADEVIMVEVITPGMTGSSPVFELKRTLAPEAGHSDPIFGLNYEKYKHFVEQFEQAENIPADMAGTPITEWAAVGTQMAFSLKAQGIYTVEGLSELTDNKLYIIGPDGRTWREKAKAFLAASKDAAYATELAAKLEQRDNDIADLKRQIAELAGALKERENTKPAKNAEKTPPANGLPNII